MTTLPPVIQNIYHNNNILEYVCTSQHFMNFLLQLQTYRSNNRNCERVQYSYYVERRLKTVAYDI
jgi:hypothetical protein